MALTKTYPIIKNVIYMHPIINNSYSGNIESLFNDVHKYIITPPITVKNILLNVIINANNGVGIFVASKCSIILFFYYFLFIYTKL